LVDPVGIEWVLIQRGHSLDGGQRWQLLHRSVYAAGMLGVLHFFWMRAAKHNLVEVGVYAGILGILLGWRMQRFMRRAVPADKSSR